MPAEPWRDGFFQLGRWLSRSAKERMNGEVDQSTEEDLREELVGLLLDVAYRAVISCTPAITPCKQRRSEHWSSSADGLRIPVTLFRDPPPILTFFVTLRLGWSEETRSLISRLILPVNSARRSANGSLAEDLSTHMLDAFDRHSPALLSLLLELHASDSAVLALPIFFSPCLANCEGSAMAALCADPSS